MLGLLLKKAIGLAVLVVNYATPNHSSEYILPEPAAQQPTADSYPSHIELSHSWGQYSPWFRVPSEISSAVPSHCKVTFVQLLSRHGSRYPTTNKGRAYSKTINKIHRNTKEYSPDYNFIKDYRYDLTVELLTSFGQQELIDSGREFFERYPLLSTASTPFVRASNQDRVVMSAQNWTQGFHQAKAGESKPGGEFPYQILHLREAGDSNNTLDHRLCTAFARPPYSHIGINAKARYAATFVPAIQSRLNKGLVGAELGFGETIDMMDLCPYNTVANNGIISPFCGLFTHEEWRQYDYLQSLDKYYGHGNGHPLASTQGVGFTNELIARMTNQPVQDSTCTNHTLDTDPSTFPLDKTLYADFSHDNDMEHIFSTMGLFNLTKPLSTTVRQSTDETHGYSAAFTVPFAGRIYFEKLQCSDYTEEEMVRIVLNDRVLPLETCGGDKLGRCLLSHFVDSLSFARSGGLWNECFK